MRSKRKEERHSYVRKRAQELAQSGNYSDWLSIEWAIRKEGYEEARSILDDHYVRKNLNETCKIAQSDAEKENRAAFKQWVDEFVLIHAPSLKQEFPSVDFSARQNGFSVCNDKKQLDIFRIFASRKITGILHSS
ncbi:MAG: hypothetical protein L0Y80_01260 [Ignavibacteriae bacterium]|nr:hypothetical protein [Ignavibacteriota bacterium]